MALVNIGQDNKDDGFYRYKMPRLNTKIEGRGNGIKTNVVNMVDVAKALSRPPAYTTKFFGCVLGAQSKFDDKTGTAIVNGGHDTSRLVEILEQFIKKYVQCYGCGNPETEVLISKTQMITLKCAACGFLSDVDMRDKLTTFILNNPPEQKKVKGGKNMRRAEKERLKAGEAADAEDKKEKKTVSKKKKSKKEEDKDQEEENGTTGDADGDDDDDEVVWQTDTSAEAAKQRMKEQLSAATSEMVMLSTEDDGEEKNAKKDKKKAGSDDSENGKLENGSSSKEASEKEAPAEAKEETEEERKEREYEELLEEMTDYVKTHKMAEVGAYVSGMGAGVSVRVLTAMLEALFADISKGLHKEFMKKKAVLVAIATSPDLQLRVLSAIEVFFGEKKKDIMKEVALVLKALYDEDILEEEQILTWFDGPYSKSKAADVSAEVAAAVRKCATPFVEWVREAEEEEEE